jgi:hypothetical protein
MLDLFNNDHKAIAIMVLVEFIIWALMSVFSIYFFIHVRVLYGVSDVVICGSLFCRDAVEVQLLRQKVQITR